MQVAGRGDSAIGVTESSGFSSSERKEVPMSKLGQFVVEFLKAEDGPTAVEYAVMLALIIVVCLVAITALGTSANATFGTVGNKIGAAGS
jgi:pilus assembly protein Flp/PilA